MLDGFKVVNQDGLRYSDECVKHKILDVVGDLYLLGHPVIGAFEGYKSGHEMNRQLLVKLLQEKLPPSHPIAISPQATARRPT